MIIGNYLFNGSKQCCDSKSGPSQQGTSDERKVGWRHVYNDKDH